MGSTLENIFGYIEEYNMINPTDKIVVGLSGGADSVCLITALCEYQKRFYGGVGNLFAVHVHHMIRGSEADEDEQFAAELCKKLGVSYISFKKDIKQYAKEQNMSLEEAGRTFRYECFENVCREKKCNKIAVAHNKNDLAETVLFNVIRGSGLKGMSGILPVRGKIIRPLLDTKRNEIEAILAELHQDYRTDSTNSSLDYDRNKIRHVILPCLEEINSEAVSHICQTAKEAENSYRYIHEEALAGYEGICEDDAGEKQVTLDINTIFKLNPVLQEHMVHEAIGDVAGAKKDISRKNVMSVTNLIYQDTGKTVDLPYGIRARRSYDKLIISNKHYENKEYNMIVEGEGEYPIPDRGKLRIKFIKNSDNLVISKNMYTKMADYGKITDTLCVRTPQEGDYITIDSKGNTKKLSRVFIDNKIDREDRKTWPVVASGNHVIWVVGLRYSEAFKIEGDTDKIICMEYIREDG